MQTALTGLYFPVQAKLSHEPRGYQKIGKIWPCVIPEKIGNFLSRIRLQEARKCRNSDGGLLSEGSSSARFFLVLPKSWPEKAPNLPTRGILIRKKVFRKVGGVLSGKGKEEIFEP